MPTVNSKKELQSQKTKVSGRVYCFQDSPVGLRGSIVQIPVQADGGSFSLPTRTMNYWSRSSNDYVTLQADG